MKNKKEIVNILSVGDVEIIFRNRIPYLCVAPTDEYGVVDEQRIGDKCVTHYNKCDQETMNKIKNEIIKILSDEKE